MAIQSPKRPWLSLPPPSSNTILVLTARDVATVSASFSPQGLQATMAHVFFALSRAANPQTATGAAVAMPHRTGVDMRSHRALFMPTRIADVGTAIKVVSVPLVPGDTRGLPASTLVLDEDTGAVKALVNARALTALRTAAGSVLATVLLHPPATARITSLVAFGAGSQIKCHVSQLLVTYPPITHVTIINRTLNDRVAALLGALRAAHPAVRFAAISSAADDDNDPAGGGGGGQAVEAAVRQADCVCCATPSTAPLFRSEWVRPGAHVILAGSYAPEMAEADAALVRRARRVLVDFRSACTLEAGELIAAGLAPGDMVEVGELFLRGRAPVHDDGKKKWEWAAEVDAARVAEVLGAGDVTIFKSVGVGAQDVAISAAVVDRAIEMGIGTRVPQFDDAV